MPITQSSPPLVLLPEWAPQDAILLAWPTPATDWAPWLDQVQATYLHLLRTLSLYHRALLLVDPSVDLPALKSKLLAADVDLNAVQAIALPYDDTWARDFGVITLGNRKQTQGLNFIFNAWGGKFESSQDNQINDRLNQLGIFAQPLQPVDMILEGGSLESDGAGTLLTTSFCLLNDNRNQVTKADIEQLFAQHLLSNRVLWLDNGLLVGDDTDAHIDTLARFVAQDCIVYQGCQDNRDEQFADLAAMKQELQQLRQANGQPYRLIELPMPSQQMSGSGKRLPASYANFLIANGKLLLPLYDCAEDQQVQSQLQAALPEYEIVGIPCRGLIEQFGSLHCISMQLPQHSLNWDRLSSESIDWASL